MKIRWLRVAVAGVLVEVALLAIAIPLNMTPPGRAVLLYSVIPLCIAGTLMGGWWAARSADGHCVIHGLLVGVVAGLIYGVLTWRIALPLAYIIGNYLKLAGGAAGGWLAQRVRVSGVPAS